MSDFCSAAECSDDFPFPPPEGYKAKIQGRVSILSSPKYSRTCLRNVYFFRGLYKATKTKPEGRVDNSV